MQLLLAAAAAAATAAAAAAAATCTPPKLRSPAPRHSQTPWQCESTRLRKRFDPGPNVAFRTASKKVIRRS